MTCGWKGWGSDKLLFSNFCNLNKYELVESMASYQVAKIITDGVVLVIYPHTTTSRHKHLRIPNENSKDKDKAMSIITAFSAFKNKVEKEAWDKQLQEYHAQRKTV